MSNKHGNVGTKMLILQQQYHHQKRLNEIYKKNLNEHNFSINNSRHYENLRRSSSKQKIFEQQNHMRSIKKLFQVLNSDKKMSDRIKDPHDFIAYPSLFFREVQTKNEAKRLKKKKKSMKTQVREHEGEMEYKISTEKIKQYLPILTNFDMSDLQQLADGLNKMIITFDIMTKEQLRNLQEKILSLMPASTPHEFLEATIALFRQAQEQMQ